MAGIDAEKKKERVVPGLFLWYTDCMARYAKTAKTLPAYFKPILWSYDIEKLGLKKHKKIIIASAVNYGGLRHWYWIARNYGVGSVRAVLSKMPATAIRKHVRPLAAIVFSVKSFNYAPRGPAKRRK